MNDHRDRIESTPFEAPDLDQTPQKRRLSKVAIFLGGASIVLAAIGWFFIHSHRSQVRDQSGRSYPRCNRRD